MNQHIKSDNEREILKLINSLVYKVVYDETVNLYEPYLNVMISNQIHFKTYFDITQLSSKIFNFIRLK